MYATLSFFYTAIVILFILLLMWYTGLAEVEEGEVNGQELLLASTSVGRMSFGVPPAVQQVNHLHNSDDWIDCIV